MKIQPQFLSTLFVLFALAFFLASLYSFILEVEYNKCDMTYMMQYPEYIPVTLPRTVQKKFPQYNLYVYNEGHSEPVRRGVYEGIPLLFIPGNDGSHKQVRSLASVAIQMRKSLGTKTRFDCFAVDLNSEFSALHGPFLYRQSEFVQHAVDHIESLYPHRPRFSIVLVGHSMGGLVARYAMTRDGFDRGRVPLIITLATPHQLPVLNTDSHMQRFYSELNSYWRSHQATSLGHVAVVSIGGGNRDIEVSLGLTRLDGLVLPRNAVWASASRVRDSWASTDHRCIVWCKQLVIALCRALFASATGGGAFADAASVFRRRLLATTEEVPAASATTTKMAGQADPSRWFYRDLADPRQRAFRFERDRLAGRLFVKIVAPPGRPVLSAGESAVVMLDGSSSGGGGGGGDGWLFACLDDEQDANKSPCESLVRLDAAVGRDLPPTGLHRRLARIDADAEAADADWLTRLAGGRGVVTALVAVLGPSDEQTELHFDLRPAAERSLRLVYAPWWLPNGGATPVVRRLPAGSLYHEAEAPAALAQFDGLELALEAHNCRALTGSPGCLVQEAAAEQQPGGDGVGGYAYAVQYFNQNASLPLAECGDGGGRCRLRVITNPLCEYSLRLSFRPHQYGAALLRGYHSSIPTWAGLQILSALVSAATVSNGRGDSQTTTAASPRSLYSGLVASPFALLAGCVACLPACISGGGGAGCLGRLIRQLSLGCLALPYSAALLLALPVCAAWLSLLMRGLACGRLTASAAASAGGHGCGWGAREFAANFANFLSPFGCILALYFTQRHCAAGGIAFLLIAQLLKTAVARLPTTQPTQQPTASDSADGKAAAVAAAAAASAATSRALTHHTAVAAVCALLACLCSPSLFVWAKTLQASGGGDTALPVADPHYWLGVAFALAYAVDSALLTTRFYAPPLDLNWPTAICVSVLIGSVSAVGHGNYTLFANLTLLLFTAYTSARCVKRLLPIATLVATGHGGRPKLD